MNTVSDEPPKRPDLPLGFKASFGSKANSLSPSHVASGSRRFAILMVSGCSGRFLYSLKVKYSQRSWARRCPEVVSKSEELASWGSDDPTPAPLLLANES